MRAPPLFFGSREKAHGSGSHGEVAVFDGTRQNGQGSTVRPDATSVLLTNHFDGTLRRNFSGSRRIVGAFTL